LAPLGTGYAVPSGDTTKSGPPSPLESCGVSLGEVLSAAVEAPPASVVVAAPWLEEKHGAKSRRNWRTLHLALDAGSGDIIAHVMTDQDAGDASQVEALLDQIDAHVLIDSTGLEIYGAGKWLEEKHSAKSRRNWRKLHLALDASSGDIIAHVMTDQDAGDASQVEALLDQIDAPIGQFTADGAYDGSPTYDAVTWHSAGATVVIPPRANAVKRPDADPLSQRDRHIAAINTDGRMKWQAATAYGKRSLVETAIGRYKSIIGYRLRARSFGAQQTEVSIGCAVLNRMLACARPKSVRCKTVTA